MMGIVYLVGAGPGDPKLITLRGLECLRSADVVIYDRLVHPLLLDEAPRDAERIYVGKKMGSHTMEQDRINQLLAEQAALGRTVVRLKGGDPFVFGRGGEEALFLAERGIDCEVVPGVTSAVSVPAAAGIPVTYRDLSSSFAVVTGHSCNDKAPDYAGLFRSAGTLVILMGTQRLADIAVELLTDGIDPDIPVAVVEQGTLPGQRTCVATLREAACGVLRSEPPAVIVVGRVVSLRDQLRRIPQTARAQLRHSEPLSLVTAWDASVDTLSSMK